MQSFDVVILGAGIVGSACAMECAANGLRVAIVEPSIPGGAATAAGMGHIVVMDDSPAQLALSNYSRRFWNDLASQLPASVEFDRSGTVWVAADAEEMDEVRTKSRTYAGADITTEILDSRALTDAEPNLRPGLAGGLLVPEDSVIYPPAAAAFFLQSAMRSGTQILRGKTAVSIAAGSVTLEDGSQLYAKQVVVATGTDTSLVPWLPIQKRKGHLVITERYPGFARHQLVELGYLKSAHKTEADSVAFNVQPRRTGQLLIGSSRQYGSESATVDHGIVHLMLERAQSYMPRLEQMSSIRIWTGFRAATPDKLPIIGPTPTPGLFLAVGFEGLGITNSLGAAKLVVDHLLQREFCIDPAPYLPSRIQIPGSVHA